MSEPDPAKPPDPRHAVGVKLFRSGLVNLINFLVGIPVMLLLVPYLLRTLGTEGYGIWTGANTLLGFVGLLGLGLVPAVSKFTAQHAARDEGAELSRMVSTALAIHGGIALVLVAGGLAFSEGLARLLFHARAEQVAGLRAVLAATLAVFLVRYPLQAYSALITGLQRQDLVQTLNMAGTLAFAGVAVLVLSSGRCVTQLLWASAAVSGVVTLAMVLVARWLRPTLAVAPGLADGASAGSLLGFGLRVAAGSVSGTLHLATDKMILISGLGRQDLVGLYHIAMETVEKIQLIPLNLLGPVMAGASELHARGEQDAVQGLYRRTQRYNSVVCALMFGGAFVVGDAFIRVWLGGERPHVVATMHVLAIGFAAATFVQPAVQLLNGMGHPGVVMGASFLGATANVVLSLAIAFTYGGEPIAWGTAISLLLEAAWLIAQFQSHTRFPLRETFVPELGGIAISAVAAGWVGARLAMGATRATPAPLFAGGVAYCALFAVLILLTGAVDRRRDWVVVERLLGRSR